jgi:hypothetical protein
LAVVRRFLKFGPILLLAGLLCACSTGKNGAPVKEEPEPKAPPDTARAAYEGLRQEILEGNFIALYDACSAAYAASKFDGNRFRASVVGMVGFKDLGITSEDLAKMKPREVVITYFRLFPREQKKDLILTMSKVKVLDERALSDGRTAVEIDSGGIIERLIWVRERGMWKMDGQETLKGPPGGK